MRVRHIPGAKEQLKEYEFYIQDPSQYQNQWHLYFQNQHPIHLEVGLGKGQFLTTLAKVHKNINYLGLEKSQEVLLQALKKLDRQVSRQELSNMGLFHYNALDLNEVFGEGNIEKIYLNFSDPWPKERHKKRRLTHQGFLKIYRGLLSEQGEIQIKTDNKALFEFSLQQLKEENFHFVQVIYNLHNDGIKDPFMTEYEEKFVKAGKTIYKCIATV
ncbi:tRNA (guanine-N(7)-)-methyltransferase [Alkaliphilus metalliredigens QYMF]|uniref:tRNA (guanine-N(7)-)-methyltransferase n=1 Tax=Alkaliphilus metalliredigens (strain QYMF) TaxID=293826 RepID=TRMB_ALKMQ|nr:tRNA (guanosine(46)-N7)-methyltransferase TrmB [Alkaliphilus metalliredigens]A6TMJ6.1 RecName: Full=tRNA (guanine-N(7)-)-methyltransferase; AltName: Full=tRNA (guanine(46)-N(7))-methyltransferase; AltName: Full=tRNA(m7G46)-methyltransferase [Alkaliphilus metalliredigens QYMF]ABR47414.1 tRNA (guanine-N(7)-)-methyltransferase [Alkaliphilus metalliredigens QYMF]